jgi:hypothetical protein
MSNPPIPLELIALCVVALATVPAAAHALELPGKLRLGREDYLTVQAIYYPASPAPASPSRSRCSAWRCSPG